MTGPFIIRAYTLAKHGILPESFTADLTAKAPKFDKWARKLIAHPSVNAGIWNEDNFLAVVKKRMGGG